MLLKLEQSKRHLKSTLGTRSQLTPDDIFAWHMSKCICINRWSVSTPVFVSSNIYLNFKQWLFHRGVTQNYIIFTRPCNFLANVNGNCSCPSQVNIHPTFPCHHIQSSWQVSQIWPPNSQQWGINLRSSPSVFKQGASSIFTFMVSYGFLWSLTCFYNML